MLALKMTTSEKRAVISLSAIMALRMIGLFMVIPLFALYAHHLQGATPTLIGVAIGIYGLTQALLQIPFGYLSDRLGRKPIIFMGLLLFALGSFISAMTHAMTYMIIGRALQGAGAIGSTILAAIADLTREEQRTKSMAIAGMTIGFSFLSAMFLGPLLNKWITVSGLFFLAMFLSFFAQIILYTLVPTIHVRSWHHDTEPEWRAFFKLLIAPELIKLNGSIFILHAIFTASFIAIPMSLYQQAHFSSDQQWHLYVPALLIAFTLSIAFIGIAEKKQQIKRYFIGSIMMLIIAEGLFLTRSQYAMFNMASLCLFFTGFSLLEAFLPSLVSRTAPASRKGSALGIFASSQFLGIFVGGMMGGWLYGKFNLTGVYLFCIFNSIFLLALSFLMQSPRYLITQTIRFPRREKQHRERILKTLQLIPGVTEVTFITEESIAYLKMERNTVNHPDFVRLKEELT